LSAMDAEQWGIKLARTQDKALLIMPKVQHARLGWELFVRQKLPMFKRNEQTGWFESELENLLPAAYQIQKKKPYPPAMTEGARQWLAENKYPVPDPPAVY
jgi:hypothetical protein